GVFPNFSDPKILWVGIEQGADRISNLAKKIDDLLQPIGFKKEKRAFVPHITIARIKNINNKDMFKEKVLKYKETFFAEETISMISLMKSDLTSQGAVYTSIKEICFGKRE
ncbi:RNA 2',3'-cyclic phosphodiesterase, partial [Chlamydiota bacterium]